MSSEVYTARMGYRGKDWLDVTRASKVEPNNPGGHLGIGLAFAPSQKLLNYYLERKRGAGITDADWEEYAGNYTREMRESYRQSRPAWDQLLARGRVVLLCFCVDPLRCHRTILGQKILPKLGATYLGEISRRDPARSI